mgnify:CR=1 FL=1
MAAAKLNLPKNYLEWLSGLGEEKRAEFGGRQWELAQREELLELLSIDCTEAPYIEQARLYVKTIAEVTGESNTFDQDGSEVPFSRIASFLTIGRDNEDLLCVDPSDGFSVWCFYPSEGGGVERLADSLDRWMDQVRLSD